MKKHFLFTLLCLIPFLAFSQKKSIDGFMDIPFGSDSATVKAAIIAKGGVKKDSISTKDYIAFSGLKLSGRTVLVLWVRFVDNKLYEGDFVFNEFTDSDVLGYYDNYSTDISAVYGKGEMTSNFGGSNNTARIRKLKSGNASCKTVWQSKNRNTITLSFMPDNNVLGVLLKYQSHDLVRLYLSKQRSDL